MSDVLIDGETGEVIARGDIAATSGLTLSVDQWADRIRSSMVDSVIAVLQVGADLLQAKAALGHGKFGSLCDELGMDQRKAQRFMQVATNAALANASHVSCLPPAYSTLAELARLEADTLTRAIEAGEVHPDMDRADAADLVARYTPKKPSTPAKPKAEPTQDEAPEREAPNNQDDAPDDGPGEEEGVAPVVPSPGSSSFTALVHRNGGRMVELIVEKGQPSPPVGARVLVSVLEEGGTS